MNIGERIILIKPNNSDDSKLIYLFKRYTPFIITGYKHSSYNLYYFISKGNILCGFVLDKRCKSLAQYGFV